MGTGSVKPCYMSKNLLQGEVFSCFSYPEEQAWVEGLKRTCHAKETFPGAGKLVDHGSGNGFDLSFSPILQNLCDFLQVHLARLISQINRPSSQLLDTFNCRVRTKAVCARSAADKLETSSLSASVSEETSSSAFTEGPLHVRAEIYSWVHTKADMSQFAPQLHTPDLHTFIIMVDLLCCSPP